MPSPVCGGLIFAGHRNAKGEVESSGVSLSFDKYGDGQMVELASVSDKEDPYGKVVNQLLPSLPSAR